MSGPSPDDFRAKVFRDRVHIGDWRVEKLCEDGESIEIAIFSGGEARLRAIQCADREYGAFDVVELEPYQRSHCFSVRHKCRMVKATNTTCPPPHKPKKALRSIIGRTSSRR